MCLCRRNNIREADPKTRHIWAAGNLCLTIGLSLTLFAKSFGEHHPGLYFCLRFALMGTAVALLLWSTRRLRNCGTRA
jgi:hypothetical protein